MDFENMSEREKKMYELWDFMVEMGVCDDREIGIACHFGGKNLETLESLLFYFTGYRNLKQYEEEFDG